jgi:predicted component of type VI protein secretion system
VPDVGVALRNALTGEQVERLSFAMQPGDEVVFGRGGDAQIPIPDPERKVSSRHGRIACAADGSVRAYDLGSLNGTYCQGLALDQNEGQPIDDGDVLRVGDYELVLQIGAAAAFEDLEATICSQDVRGSCDRLVDRLQAVWAAELGGPTDARHAALRTEIDAATAPLKQREADVLLADLAGRFGLATEPPAARSAPGPTAPVSAPVTTPPSPAGADASVLKALAGRLVPDSQLETDADAEAFAELLHQFTQCALDWLAKALAGRGVFAREFGAEVTLIFQRSNNPLKTMDRDQLMQYLLDWRAETDADTRSTFWMVSCVI